MITISSIAAYKIPFYSADFLKSSIVAISYSFSWVVLAWALTDRCILRKPNLYIILFVILFLEKMFWSFYPEISSYEQFLDIFHLYIIIDFLIMIVFFTIFWYLTKPQDFKSLNSFLKTKNSIFVLFASFFITMPPWLTRFVLDNAGQDFLKIIYSSNFSFNCFIFMTNAIPFIISLLFFSFIIKNIRSNKRFALYGLLIIFPSILYLPFNNFLYYGATEDFLKSIFYFIVFGISYFMIFLSFTLLSKSKYLE